MKEVVDFIGLAIAGLLALLWFDLRNIRKGFMTEGDHAKLCKIRELEQEISLRDHIDNKFEDLKTFIKNGNSESG